MKKFIYDVLKPFKVILKGRKGPRLAKRGEDDISGSSFKKGQKYVDYDFPNEEVGKSPLTKLLRRKRFIKLNKVVEKKRDK